MSARTSLPLLQTLPDQDFFGRVVDDRVVREQVEAGTYSPCVVEPSISGLTRLMTILTGKRTTGLIKWAWHGDAETFCPPIWADIAIGSGACGFGCRGCFLMLTFRVMRDPFRPVVYVNGQDFARQVAKWLRATKWPVVHEGPDGKEIKRQRERTSKDAVGLGIDCSDSLLWEGVTGHARLLVPLFPDAKTNPLGNPLVLLTKSANVHYLEETVGGLQRDDGGRVKNVVVSMSLNPEPMADLWEGKYPDTGERITPPISKRLAALKRAQDMGFEVRARIDPILTPPGWEKLYEAFFDEMAHEHGVRPSMLTLGTYREKMPQLDRFREKWGLLPMEFEPVTSGKREGTHRHAVDREHAYRTVRDIIGRVFKGIEPGPCVSLCKETHAVRKATNLCSANCNCLPRVDSLQRRLPILG